jgi:hypothetical protein
MLTTRKCDHWWKDLFLVGSVFDPQFELATKPLGTEFRPMLGRIRGIGSQRSNLLNSCLQFHELVDCTPSGAQKDGMGVH